jgi:hypothetical protein
MNRRKLTDEQVAQIRQLATTNIKKTEIARQFGVSPQLISTVIRYGYDRPKEEKEVQPLDIDKRKCWEAIASEYTTMYPHDPITPAQAKRAHDLAIDKLKCYFRNHIKEHKELLGEHHASLLRHRD